MPDLHVETVNLIAEGDLLAGQFTMTGTHRGELFGVPATDKPVRIEGVDIMRFASGKAVEHWGFWDSMKLLQQLGVAPTP
jgi:predicted ester cyclase